MIQSSKMRWPAVILTALFLIPFIGAILFYINRDQIHYATKNKGRLITPPLSLSALSLLPNPKLFAGKWILLYVVPTNSSGCNEGCRKNLRMVRQVHTALGKDQSRVSSAVIPYKGGESSLKQHLFLSKNVNNNGQLFIVDPLGNIMMTYDDDNFGEALYKDLTHLLKASKIG